MMRRLLTGAVPIAVLLFLILVLMPAAADQDSDADGAARIAANRRAGRPAQALYHIEAQAAHIGWTPELLRTAGDVWQEMGSPARALPYWQAASQQLRDTTLLRQIAQTAISLERWPDAMDALTMLSDALPADAWSHYQLGMIRAASDPATARAHLLAALQDERYAETSGMLLGALDAVTDVPVTMRVGQVLMVAGLWSYAQLAFEQAAADNAPYADALAYAGLMRLRQGKSTGAWVEQALLINPESALVQYVYGLHLRAVGDFTASRLALGRAVALDSMNPAYYAELGTAYRLTGDLAGAAWWLATAVSVSGGDARYIEALALFRAETGYAGPELPENAADSPDVRAERAWTLHLTGDSAAALAELDAVLESIPDQPRALYYKAQILLMLDERDEATALLSRLVEQDSAFRLESQRILDRLSGG